MTRVLLALLVVLATGCAQEASAPARPVPVATGATFAARPVGPASVEVLRSWDTARAQAWAHGEPRLLRRLYTSGSRAGRRDRAMLRAWAERGLRVRDLQTQLLSVRERSRSRTTWTLSVTDRLAGGFAVGRALGRDDERPLPRGGPTTYTVRLRLVDGRWRVAAVLPAVPGS